MTDNRDTIHALAALLRKIKGQSGGFLNVEDLAELADLDRLRPVLIRWHQGRAVAPAQNAADLMQATEAGGWTLRDVSLPSTDQVYATPADPPRRPAARRFEDEPSYSDHELDVDAGGSCYSDADPGL